eukprot:sb/3475954/
MSSLSSSRTKWSEADTICLLFCHHRSRPGTAGVWKRLERLWEDAGHPHKSVLPYTSRIAYPTHMTLANELLAFQLNYFNLTTYLNLSREKDRERERQRKTDQGENLLAVANVKSILGFWFY